MSANPQSSLRKVHFTGVCGTAMGSLAAALRDRGVIVTGSDENVYPPMSDFLRGNGIEIVAGYRPE
ncbi:MAG: Mur ligase domain-containing protein, partial [Chthoniobacterales bacterium]